MELTDENIRALFRDAGDFNARTLRTGPYTLYIYAIDGLTSGGDISDFVIRPIQGLTGTLAERYNQALTGAIWNAVAKPCADLQAAGDFLINGFSLVLFPEVGAIAFETKTGEKRSISPPELENTAKGARDGFIESIRTNTGLIRRHLRTPKLRLWESKVGEECHTNVCVVWLDGITDPELVARMKNRLTQIQTEGFLSPAAVEEAVTGGRFTAFPLLQYTERTDRFCQGILDGRVGLLVDGIPLGYLAPVDIGYLMNSQEDLSRNFIAASAVRILRYLALLLDLLLPALYVAFTVHHQALLPTALAQVILRGREGVPFSPIWEIVALLAAFELLQESGIHLPQNTGQSVSIIGGIVVGTVGVEAGLISSVALIAVSVAGVCGFVLPNRDLANAIRLWRFWLVLTAALLGLWGIVLGMSMLILRLVKLKSLGRPYIRLLESRLLRENLG